MGGNLERSRRRITRGDHFREYRGRILPSPEVTRAKDRMGRGEGRRVRMGALPLSEENINHDIGATLVRSCVHPTTSSYVGKR